MQGNKHTFINSQTKTFYKQYTKTEYTYLKMLHDYTGLTINLVTINNSNNNNTQYITMPAAHVISIDTIPQKRRSNLSHIITANIPFILDQISYLNNLGIYYSDCLQWLYYQNKLYLIDFDTAYMNKIDYNYNNYDLLKNFLSAFNIDYKFITESLNYLDLFQGDGFSFSDKEQELYNKLNDPTMLKNHIYYSSNRRHIQLNIPNIHIYGSTGNMIITETILNPELKNEWELIKIV